MLFYLILIIGTGIYFFLTWNYKHWEKRGIPYPKPKLFCGNFPGAVKQKEHISYEFDKIYKEFKDRYSFVGIYNMRSPQYLVTDASVAKEILIAKFQNFHDNEFADMSDKAKDPILASHPFMLKGQEWKEKRAEFSPAFTNSRIKALYPIFQETSELLQKYILRAEGRVINADEMCSNYTIDAVTNCVFGADAGALSGGKAPIREMGKRIIFSTKLMLYFIAGQLFPTLKKIYKISLVEKVVVKFFVNLLRDAIDLRVKSNNKRKDYLNYILDVRARKNLSELDMVAHIIAFVVDGFEQPSVILSWTLFELGKRNDIQMKLRKEIRETIDKNGGELNLDIVQDMPYLEQVLSESLRLHTAGVFLSKMCTESCELPLTTTKMAKIEEGYSVIIPIFSIHRDARYYDDPETFNPERFAPENGGTKIHKEKGTFIPFSDGPRICLGIRFVQAQLKAALIAIVRDFEITVDAKTAKNPVLDPKEILPFAKGGIWLKFKEIRK